MTSTDWSRWHEAYARPGSGLDERLRAVRTQIERHLNASSPRPARVVSACAGDGRDLLGVLARRRDADRVTALLVELDPGLARCAREAADALPANGYGAGVDQRISFVTLAVADLDASRRFYLDGLGWRAELDVPGEVVMIRAGEHLVLSLWERSHFEAEVGAVQTGPGLAPFTLAHNVPERADVDAVLATARAAGADPVQDAVAREWGGYTGYFGDPDGYRWEIAYNPGEIGQLVLPDRH